MRNLHVRFLEEFTSIVILEREVDLLMNLKVWPRIFMLCAACVIYMQGGCLAGNGNWVEYYRAGCDVFLANADLVEAREWNGRKYLAVTILHKNESDKRPFQRELLLVIDVENRKGITLKPGQQNISGIAKSNNWGEPGEKLFELG